MQLTISGRKRTLAASALVAASAAVLPVTASPDAHADSCTYRSLTKSDVDAYGYVGYVEMQWSDGCHTVRTHFHVDSAFLSGHSGWNVRLGISGGLNSGGSSQYSVVSTPYPNNTSYADYYSASAAYNAYPTELFTSWLDWTYNDCSVQWVTATHDFSNGANYGNGGAEAFSQGCHT
ncbi:hypothetical protein [Streptomyces sp. NK08204]|uniref:hypothetical protein n=1 Tax=Streptomyces sp. NK08204 TaxID=2873260 RepID=UPI001CECEA13|nr:hypothetical protein [Streptomyces sp. NK08204]